MEMGILQMLQHVFRIQAGLFIFYMDGVNSTYQTMKMTKPCVLNNSCDLPCRLHPYTSVTVMWFNGYDEMLSQGMEIRKKHNILRIEKPVFDEWTLRILRVNRNHEDTYQCRTNNGSTLAVITVVIELIEGIKGHKLIIRDVKRYASGDYTCVASNIHGTTKRHIRLIVTFAPEVTVMEQEVYAAGGEEVTMGCVVQASPLYDAFWINNKGSKVENTTRPWKYKVEVEEESDLFPVRFLELRIKANTLYVQDEGNYTCQAFGGSQDTSSAVVVLKVKD